MIRKWTHTAVTVAVIVNKFNNSNIYFTQRLVTNVWSITIVGGLTTLHTVILKMSVSCRMPMLILRQTTYIKTNFLDQIMRTNQVWANIFLSFLLAIEPLLSEDSSSKCSPYWVHIVSYEHSIILSEKYIFY